MGTPFIETSTEITKILTPTGVFSATVVSPRGPTPPSARAGGAGLSRRHLDTTGLYAVAVALVQVARPMLSGLLQHQVRDLLLQLSESMGPAAANICRHGAGDRIGVSLGILPPARRTSTSARASEGRR